MKPETIDRIYTTGTKKPLRTNQQGLNLVSTAFARLLNQVEREPSSFRHFRIVPKLVLQSSKSGTKAANFVQPDTLKVDLFGSARISRKEPIATGIRGTTPRTVRQSELEPCRKWAPQVHASGY